MERKIDLFLDSGAYSAKTQGVEIDMEEYIQFIHDNKECIEIYANLDVIGDAKKTFQNQKIMERAGLQPLPVFHAGEDVKYLLKYIEEYDYICLGGMVGSSTSALKYSLDDNFALTCDSDGMPKVKVHGFGLTSLPLILRYPWYSVDSTSWVLTGRMGSIFVPVYRSGEWRYDVIPAKVGVSNRSPSLKEKDKHISTLPSIQKQLVMNYLEEKGYILGKSRFERVPADRKLQGDHERWAEKKVNKASTRLLEIIEERGLSNTYQLRDEINIIYFLDLEKTRPPWPWKFERQSMEGLGL